jgi:hypothetical protein
MEGFVESIKDNLEPLAKVSKKDIKKSFPRELESLGQGFLVLNFFRSLVGKVFYPLGI